MPDIGVRIVADGEGEFKTALSAINASLSSLDAQAKEAASGIAEMGSKTKEAAAKNELIADSVELYEQKLEILEKQQSSANTKLESLGKALTEAKNKFGENSKEATAAANAYNKQREVCSKLDKAVADTNKAMNDTPGKIDKLVDAEKGGEQETENWQKAIEDMSKIMKLDFAGTVINACISGINSLASAMSGAVSSAFDMARAAGTYADDLNTMASQTGIATKSLQEWSYASNFIDTSVDTITSSMTKMTKNMSSTSEDTTEAWKQLGIAVTDSKGNLRDSETVFFEAIDALGKVKNETERDTLAMTLFGRSAKELNPLIEAGSKAFKGYAQEASEMGVVFSQDSLNAMNSFDDSMQKVNQSMSGLTTTIGSMLIPAFQPLADAASTTMGKISASLKDGLQKSDINVMVNTFKESFGTAFKQVGTVVKDAIPIVLDALEQMLVEIKRFFDNDFPAVASAIGQVFSTLGSIITPYVEPIAKQAMDALASAMNQTLAKIDWGGIGLSLLQGIWNGITGALSWLWSKLEEFCDWVAGKIKDFFGIHSPSTVMAEIGDFLMQGFGNGILDGVAAVLKIVADVFGKIWDTIKGFFGGGDKENEDAKSEGAAIMSSMGDGIKEEKEQMVKEAEQATKDAIAATCTGFGMSNPDSESIYYKGIGEQLMDSIGNGIKELSEELNKAGKEVIDSLFKAVQTAIGGEQASVFQKIGKCIDQGIAKGITDNESSITRAAEEAAKAAYNAACEALDIHSPSKLFRNGVGRMITAGMALGISDGTGDVSAAIGSMTDGIADFSVNGSTTAARSGGLTVYQTVNANQTSYAAQQREAAQQMANMARRLGYGV